MPAVQVTNPDSHVLVGIPEGEVEEEMSGEHQVGEASNIQDDASAVAVTVSWTELLFVCLIVVVFLCAILASLSLMYI